MMQARLHQTRFRSNNIAQQRPTRALRLCVQAATNPRTARLRQLLRGDEIIIGPCCHDGLSARLIERAGFPYAFMSGFCTSAARLGAPDTGLISYAEMVDVGRNIHEATQQMPVIGDGDTGYGNALNVKRTVRGYAQAGFAGILIEDQVAPKSCGHVRNKRVVSREEAVARIRAAVDAREEGADILIVARTDARQAVSLEEALWRAQAFAEAGADVLFIDALASEDEMRAFTSLGGAAGRVPKMANNLEGGGKTPILSPSQLQRMGFKVVAYPLSLLGVSIRAMEQALQGIKRGDVPPPQALGTFTEIQAAVGFPEYYAEEAKYAVSSPTPSAYPGRSHEGDKQQQAPPPPPPPPPRPQVVEADIVMEEPPKRTTYSSSASTSSAANGSGSSSSSWSSSYRPPGTSSSASTQPGTSEPGSWPGFNSPSSNASANTNVNTNTSGGSSMRSSEPSVPVTQQQRQSGGDQSYRRSRSFRVKISDKSTGMVKLETRIPAGFLNGITALVPQVSGFNIEKLLDEAMNNALPESGQPLLTLPSGSNDFIQIYLE